MSLFRPLLVIGTRPEAIKLAPVLAAFRQQSGTEPLVCLTGQHQELLAPILTYFDIRADFQLDVMRPNQSLASLTARALEGLDDILVRATPNCVVAQGDTTSVLAAALAAFYRKLPLVHVEAGLRTGDLEAPWPEEFNRRLASLATTLHCAPTPGAADNLRAEGFPAHTIRITGNPVVDALLQTVARERQHGARWEAKYAFLKGSQLVLITGHRRENLGRGFDQICGAIAALANLHPTTQFVYPVHLNPQVHGPVHQQLGHLANVHLVPPADYPEFVWLMDRARLILTDSGGVQEEAPSLRKPVLVLRTTTERPEAVAAGLVELVGTDEHRIIARTTWHLQQALPAQHTSAPANPYGDGHAAGRIATLAQQAFGERHARHAA